MAKMKKPVYLILALVLVSSLMVGGLATVLADQHNDLDSFDILVLKNGDWHLHGELDFSDYETLQLPVDNGAGQLKLRLEQHGHDAAFVDYVAVRKENATYHPISAINIDSGKDVLTKVLSPEYDVCDACESTLEIVWDSVPENVTLVIRAVEEDFGADHGGPLYHPYIPRGYTLSYTLVNDGGITADGMMEESTEPAFSAFWKPSSPHPDGYTYGWLHCDEDYLYAAIEVTADNTPDEEDWGALYVMVDGELKEFRVSCDEAKWGANGFQYTSSVSYEHRIYEFEIPLSEINAIIGDEIQYGFGCYGTVVGVQVLIQTVPAHTGYITIDGFEIDHENKHHGEVVSTAPNEDYSIVAHPGSGYGFSEWQTEGHVFVNEPYEAITVAWVELNLDEDGYVLTMVQTELPVGGEAYPVSKASVLAPWIVLVVVILTGTALLIKRKIYYSK
ncbi:hypothetical protein ACFLVV_01080 [Chloroflexota bacterium]